MKRIAVALAAFVAITPVFGGVAAAEPLPTSRSRAEQAVKDGLPDDPAPLRRQACAAVVAGLVEASEPMPVAEGACVAPHTLTVRKAGGLPLSGEPRLDCALAVAVALWATKVDQAARQMLGAPISRVLTGPGFECRNRNRAAAGKLSEHAFANALDITGFELADGRTVVVEGDWPHATDGGSDAPWPDVATLRASRQQRATTAPARFLAETSQLACGHFSTVLTPDSNAQHRNHLHFDLGCHGRDCSYLICE